MNRKTHLPPRQTPLPLNGDLHWTQLPPEVRDRCRVLLVELLTRLAQSPASAGDDDER